MASTGVDGMALFELLEAEGFEVSLVPAQPLKYVPGRQSAVLDGQWIQPWHRDGRLSASFPPAEAMAVLRPSVRQRETLMADAARHVQRRPKALTQMNLPRHQVLRVLTGLSGLRI
jgi:transposase